MSSLFFEMTTVLIYILVRVRQTNFQQEMMLTYFVMSRSNTLVMYAKISTHRGNISMCIVIAHESFTEVTPSINFKEIAVVEKNK